MPPQRVTILGSTGHVGISTLDVIKRNPLLYQVFALSANTNVEMLLRQCQSSTPEYAVLRCEASAARLREALLALGSKTVVLSGEQGLDDIASDTEVDMVMAAIVGAAGLSSSLAAARAGKRLLLANKESLVMSGRLFMQTLVEHGARLLPIDSEHNAVFQAMANGNPAFARGIKRIILTASGGPFLHTPLADLANMTPKQACAHPNWRMGRKISVDSATMMNKGLECIEARWLFDIDVDNVEIVIHPQSVIHSMVEYIDGSILSQMGHPDMRIPVAHGLSWPDRVDSGVPGLDLMGIKPITFEALDRTRFPCVVLAEAAARGKDSDAIVLNAANEIAVAAFLHELIGFTAISKVVEGVMQSVASVSAGCLEDILEIDHEARTKASAIIQSNRR